MDFEELRLRFDHDFTAEDRAVRWEKRFPLSLSMQCQHVHKQQQTSSAGGHGRGDRGLRGRVFKKVQGEVSERAVHLSRGQKRILGIDAVRGSEKRPVCKCVQFDLHLLYPVTPSVPRS